MRADIPSFGMILLLKPEPHPRLRDDVGVAVLVVLDPRLKEEEPVRTGRWHDASLARIQSSSLRSWKSVPRQSNRTCLSTARSFPAYCRVSRFGNTGVGIILGPGQFNWDFSVLKNTRLGENRSLQFRAEFFNLFNHAQFDNPNPNSIPYEPALPNVSSPDNFGQIVKTSVNPRVIQLALKFVF